MQKPEHRNGSPAQVLAEQAQAQGKPEGGKGGQEGCEQGHHHHRQGGRGATMIVHADVNPGNAAAELGQAVQPGTEKRAAR